jgi:hypothetical protein
VCLFPVLKFLVPDRLFILWAGPFSYLFLLIALAAINWPKFADQLRNELTTPPIDPRRVLIVRSPADEASGALVFSQFISWITARGYLWLETGYAHLDRKLRGWAERRWTLLAVASLSFAVFIACLRIAEVSSEPLRVILSLIGVVSLLILIIALALVIPFEGVDSVIFAYRAMTSPLIWPAIFLLFVLLLPFGWRVALSNILLDVTAETTPLGLSWTVHLIRSSEKRQAVEDRLPTLAHSSVYDDPLVLKVVCDWIANGPEAPRCGDADILHSAMNEKS